MKVALLMGSDSDMKRLEPCLEVLARLEIPYVARVLSAHRTPQALVAFVQQEAPALTVRVFICAAGGAAHLAGVVAAHSTLPVIGVPLDNPPMDGMDSLLATVQMPGGVPVAAVGAGRGGPVNAALLALRIIGVADSNIAARMEAFKTAQRDRVLEKDAGLQKNLDT